MIFDRKLPEMDQVKVKSTQQKNKLIIQAATTPSIRMIASCEVTGTQENTGKGGAGRVF